jgi:hypothetical protein
VNSLIRFLKDSEKILRSDDTTAGSAFLALLAFFPPFFLTGVGSGTTSSSSSCSDSYTFSFALPFVFLGSLAIFFRPILFYTFLFISTTNQRAIYKSN